MPGQEQETPKPKMIEVPDWSQPQAAEAASRLIEDQAPSPWSKEAVDLRKAGSEVLTEEHRDIIEQEVGDEALEATGVEEPEDIDDMKVYRKLPRTHSVDAVSSTYQPRIAPEERAPYIPDEQERTLSGQEVAALKAERHAQAEAAISEVQDAAVDTARTPEEQWRIDKQTTRAELATLTAELSVPDATFLDSYAEAKLRGDHNAEYVAVDKFSPDLRRNLELSGKYVQLKKRLKDLESFTQ